MKEIMEGFRQRLRQLRIQKKLSQTELGQIAGMHYNHIGRYERGGSLPTAEALQRLADALGVSSDYLLNGDVTVVAKANFEDLELLQQFKEVQKLPDEDKFIIKKLVNAFLVKKQLEHLAAK